MESSLQHVIFTEGADLYRDLREWRTIWREALQGQEATSAAPPPPRPSKRLSSPLTHPSKRLSCPLHAYYPFLFHTLFQEVPLETVRELARADRLYTEHLLSYDRILDHRKSIDMPALFLAQLEHMQSLKRLYQLFPVSHSFWSYFYGCYFETWRSFREERLWHSHRIGPFSFRRFRALAKGKTAVLRPFTMALAFLSDRTAELHHLSASLDQHHIALVLIDDLEDWRQDFQSFNFTYLLTRLIQDAGLEDEMRSGRPVSRVRIGRLLHTTGRIEKQLRLAEIFFWKSNETVDGLSLPLWKHFNNGFHARCLALRHDLAEIQRREKGRTRMRASLQRENATAPTQCLMDPRLQQIQSGVRFLAGCLGIGGAFPLSVSPHAYMRPSKAVAASRSVTTLILRAIEPVKALDPAVAPLLRSAWFGLRDLHDVRPHPGLPATLEGAFEGKPLGPDQLSQRDRSFVPHFGPLRDGLRWANFLFTCSQEGFRPPRLTAYVADCVRREWYTPWSFGVAFGPVESPWTRYACRPLLALLLICQALGREVSRKALHDYLLAPSRTPGYGHNTTDIALILLCLFLTDYDGPELTPAIQKISESQEPDGSWAPNAIYREGSHYYGSRELTTAWCLEALFRNRVSLESGPGCRQAIRSERIRTRGLQCNAGIRTNPLPVPD